MVIANPALAGPKILSSKGWVQYESGVGDLTTWYEKGVETQRPKRAHVTIDHPNKGALPKFPRLNAMPGDANSSNMGYHFGKGLKLTKHMQINQPKLEYEEAYGAFSGYRIFPNPLGDEDMMNKSKTMQGVYDISGENIAAHEAQAPHGQHSIDEQVKAQVEEHETQHTMGDAQEARDAGYEREENPAIMGQGEEAFHNQQTLPTDAPVATPMDVDAIRLEKDNIVHVEDTQHGVGVNQQNV